MHKICLHALLILTLFIGCSKAPEEKPLPPSRQEIIDEFAQLTQEEFEITVYPRFVDDTFWVYIPIDGDMLKIKTQPPNNQLAAPTTQPGFNIQFLETTYNKDAKSFSIIYDIIRRIRVSSDFPGYEMAYTDEVSQLQRKVFHAFQQIFLQLEPNENNDHPEFLGIVMADTESGLFIESAFNLNDLKIYMAHGMPYEEYTQRSLNKTGGNAHLVGDTQGDKMDYLSITWPYFLSKQIENRIKYKYTQSAFPPNLGDDADHSEFIMPIIANTLRYYDFNDYTQVELHNLRRNENATILPDEVKTFEEEKSKLDKGRLIQIKFAPSEDGSFNIENISENLEHIDGDNDNALDRMPQESISTQKIEEILQELIQESLERSNETEKNQPLY